jgi:hypothetical protein
VRIRLTWTSIDDEEEKQCQAMWAEKMKNPRRRKVMKSLMIKWIGEYKVKVFMCVPARACACACVCLPVFIHTKIKKNLP